MHATASIPPAAATTWWLPREGGSAEDRRAHRVAFLLLITVVLSLADLLATLWCMSTVGMYEANPLVRYLAACPYPGLAIGTFKLASVAVSVGLVLPLRRRAAALLGAWIMVAVLAWLTIQWARYGAVMGDPEMLVAAEMVVFDQGWVQLN
jgi:hypothetical protein